MTVNLMIMRSRIRRSKDNLKPIQIKDRDKEVLRAVCDYRILSTEQIYRLLFPSISRARKRLFQLWQHGYLDRLVKPIRLGEGSSIFLYSLTKKGVSLLESTGFGHLKSVRNHKISREFSEHTIRTNDFRLCLELACRNSDAVMFQNWKQGKDLKIRIPVNLKSTAKSIVLIPDAYFELNSGGRKYVFFLEIDRGTADLGRIKSKIIAYLSLWNDKTPASNMSLQSFRVLYVTTGKMRLGNMLGLLKTLPPYYSRPDIIYLTDFDKYSPESPMKILELIWRTIQRGGNDLMTRVIPAPFPSKLPTVPGKPPVR
jgi:hypothetical protein